MIIVLLGILSKMEKNSNNNNIITVYYSYIVETEDE